MLKGSAPTSKERENATFKLPFTSPSYRRTFVRTRHKRARHRYRRVYGRAARNSRAGHARRVGRHRHGRCGNVRAPPLSTVRRGPHKPHGEHARSRTSGSSLCPCHPERHRMINMRECQKCSADVARGEEKNSSGLSPSAVVLAAKPGAWTRRGTVLASQGRKRSGRHAAATHRPVAEWRRILLGPFGEAALFPLFSFLTNHSWTCAILGQTMPIVFFLLALDEAALAAPAVLSDWSR